MGDPLSPHNNRTVPHNGIERQTSAFLADSLPGLRRQSNRDHTSYRRRSRANGDRPLTVEERRFMLLVERGDCASVIKLIDALRDQQDVFDIDCVDPLGRSALSIAIINENPELMEILLEKGIATCDSLLLAISEEYVEGVELLLDHEERSNLI